MLPSPQRIKPWAVGALRLRLRLREIGVTPGRDMAILPGISSMTGQYRMRGSDLAPGGSFSMLWPQTSALRIPCFPDRWGTLPVSLLRE